MLSLYNFCTRWFCLESGNAADKPSVILIHGFPSQAYLYRKVLPVLSKDYHAITFVWFEFVSALDSVIDELGVKKVSLVVQGYFAPIVVKYASNHQDKLNDLILLNPPIHTLPQLSPYNLYILLHTASNEAILTWKT